MTGGRSPQFARVRSSATINGRTFKRGGLLDELMVVAAITAAASDATLGQFAQAAADWRLAE